MKMIGYLYAISLLGSLCASSCESDDTRQDAGPLSDFYLTVSADAVQLSQQNAARQALEIAWSGGADDGSTRYTLDIGIDGDAPAGAGSWSKSFARGERACVLTHEELNRIVVDECNVRELTHWVGGMGVLVFMLIVLPLAGGHTIFLMRAESPGPSVSKMSPHMRDTATILYAIYFGLTVLQMILLLIGGMPFFDAICVSLGTAGTGGFGNWNDSIAHYNSAYLQNVITVFMILFGINFSAYFLILTRKFRQAFRIEEIRVYLGVIFVFAGLIAFNVRPMFGSLRESFHHALFQVASIITTTGFSTVDFDQWPTFSRALLVLLMFIGACAGSTGGGIKCSRILLLGKSVKKELMCLIHPRLVRVNKMDGQRVPHEVMRSINVFVVAYAFIFILSLLIISLNCEDLVTCFTSVATTLNNVGPGLSLCGPTCNFGFFPPLSKCVLIFDMLAGRLELFPMLLLFTPGTWQRNK